MASDEDNAVEIKLPRGIATLDQSMLIEMDKSDNLGVQGGRNLSNREGKIGLIKKQFHTDLVKQNADISDDLIKGNAVEITASQQDDSVILRAKNGTLDVDKVIDSFNGNVRLPRTPRIFALPKGIDSDTALKLIKRAKDTVEEKNDKFGRADPLFVFSVPKEEYVRQVIKGEVEKEIETRLNKVVGDEEIKSLKVAEKFRGKKVSELLPDLIESCESGSKSSACKLIDDVTKDVVVQNPVFERGKQKKNLRKEGIEGVDLEESLDSLKTITVTGLKLNLLKGKVFGKDNGKIEVSGSFNNEGDDYDLEKPVLFSDSIERNRGIVNAIKSAQPFAPDTFTPVGTSHDKSNFELGKNTARIGENKISAPILPDEVKKVLFENPDIKNNLSKEAINDLEKWKNRQEQFDLISEANDINRCPVGSIEVVRLSNISKGMTPPQKICRDEEEDIVRESATKVSGKGSGKKVIGKSLSIKERMQKRVNMEENVKQKALALNSAKTDKEKEKASNELDKARTELQQYMNNDKFVGCDSDEELAYVNEIKLMSKYSAENTDRITKFLNRQTKEDDVKDIITYLKKQGFSEKTIMESVLTKDELEGKIPKKGFEDKVAMQKKIVGAVKNPEDYKVPMRYPVQTNQRGMLSFCKDLTNSKPNMRLKVKKNRKLDSASIDYTVKSRKKPVTLIEKEK